MDESPGYNGWTIYETWLVALWLNNDRLTYDALEAIKQKTEACIAKPKSLRS